MIMLRDGRSGGASDHFPNKIHLSGHNHVSYARGGISTLCHCADVAPVLLSSRSGWCVKCFSGGTLLICQVAIFVATRFLCPIGAGTLGCIFFLGYFYTKFWIKKRELMPWPQFLQQIHQSQWRAPLWLCVPPLLQTDQLSPQRTHLWHRQQCSQQRDGISSGQHPPRWTHWDKFNHDVQLHQILRQKTPDCPWLPQTLQNRQPVWMDGND